MFFSKAYKFHPEKGSHKKEGFKSPCICLNVNPANVQTIQLISLLGKNFMQSFQFLFFGLNAKFPVLG